MSVRAEYVLTGLWAFVLSAFCVEHLGIYGRVYPVKEESILERLKNAKVQNIHTGEIEKKLLRAAEVNLGLPAAKALRVSEERIIFKAPQDLRVGSKIIVKKGEEVNVLSARKRYPDLIIYMALPVIVEKLKIRAVPTVVYQSGDRLVKVEVPWAEGRVLLPF